MKVCTGEDGVPTYWGTSGRSLQILITALATTDFLLFGYDQGVMSGIISSPEFTHDFPEVEGNSTYEGFVVAIYAVGCFLGACFILSFGDYLGRRKSIFLGAFIMIIGVIIQLAAVPVGSGATAQFIIGRCITGVGNGINTSTVPTWQAECSRSHNRGKLICIEGGNVAIGTLIAYWIDYGCLYGPHDMVWRFPIAFQCVFAIVVIILMLRLPESPRWLLTKDRHADAQTVLAALAGSTRDDTEINVQLNVIVDSIRASGHEGGITPVSALFTNGKSQHFRRMVLGASSQMMQQLSGCNACWIVETLSHLTHAERACIPRRMRHDYIFFVLKEINRRSVRPLDRICISYLILSNNAVIYYFPILFQDAIGVSHNLALLLGGINMIVYSIFATTSWFAVERIGRRKLFLIGTVGQCLCMVISFGALIPDTEEAAKGAAVGLFTYIAFFGATWLPLPWLYPAEINPLKTRAKANAVSTVSNWLWNFFIVMITPVLIENIGWGTYLFFAVMNAIFFPIIYFFYPETSQRSLEEIDLIFAKGYIEKMNYVKAAKELPRMSEEEIDARAREYGVGSSSDDEDSAAKELRMREKERNSEKEEDV